MKAPTPTVRKARRGGRLLNRKLAPLAWTAALAGFIFAIAHFQLYPKINNPWSSTADRPRKPTGPVLFSCPDGRRGLHLVHIRFLIGQTQSNTVFLASRLLLMRTFLVPSLQGQTARGFVVYVAHDPHTAPHVLQAVNASLEGVASYVLTGPETNLNNPSLDMGSILARISKVEPAASDLDIIVISRMDLDDAVHVLGVDAVQKAVCDSGQTKVGVESSNEAGGLQMKMVYMDRGMLLYPAEDSAYGKACEWNYKFKPHLAIMQSMALIASETEARKYLRTCPLNVYSYPHYKPDVMEGMVKAAPPECGTVSFTAASDVVRWRPPDGKIGCLYTKTASSWSYGKLDHKNIECVATDAQRVTELFNIAPHALGLFNIMFVGFEEEAPGLLASNTKQALE